MHSFTWVVNKLGTTVVTPLHLSRRTDETSDRKIPIMQRVEVIPTMFCRCVNRMLSDPKTIDAKSVKQLTNTKNEWIKETSGHECDFNSSL